MNNLKTVSFAENILPLQREQLLDWLSDHTYAEVQALVAAPPPDGFGLEVSIPTLCRYYKKNFERIDELRHNKLHDRLRLYINNQAEPDENYRHLLADGATLILQERFYEMLGQPVDSVDELKKLASVAKIIKDLKIEMNPVKAVKDRVLSQMARHPLDDIITRFQASRATTTSPSAATPEPIRSSPENDRSDPAPPSRKQ